jgi:hypothetical protein
MSLKAVVLVGASERRCDESWKKRKTIYRFPPLSFMNFVSNQSLCFQPHAGSSILVSFYSSKRTNCDTHRIVVTFFRVEDGSSTNRAEPEYELRSLIADANVLGGGTEDFERSGEAGQRCEDTAGPLLAGEAMAEADSSWFAFDLNAQLSARARGCSGRHLGTSSDDSRDA